ncbi:MAG: hypothetical protein QM730_23670 [Anaerolineales bacterium]
MQKSSTAKLILLLWATLCIIFFMLFPGKVSFIRWTDLANWQFLPEKLSKTDFTGLIPNLAQAFIGLLVFSCACISLGKFTQKALKIELPILPSTGLTRLAIICTDFLVGQGLYSLVFLAFAGTHKLTSMYVYILLLAGILSGFGQLKRSVLELFTKSSAVADEKPARTIYKFIYWSSISVLILSIFCTMARLSYDFTAIYFSDARITALTGKTNFFMNDTFVVSVFQTAIQFTALMLSFGDQSARLFSWMCGVVIIIVGMAIGERMKLSKRALYILLMLMVTTTALSDLMGDGKVDLISTAPAVAAIYWIVVGSVDRQLNRSSLLLVGFLCGLAIVGRPFNAFLLGIFIILFYFQNILSKNGFGRTDFKPSIISLFWIGVGVGVLGLYHLFANWIILGNPFAFITSLSKINPSNGPWGFNPQTIFLFRLFYPFVATYLNTPQSLGNMSPVIVAFIPILFIQDVRKDIHISRELFNLAVVCLVTLLLWVFLFFTVLEFRYVLSIWIILFIPLAQIVAGILENQDYVLRTTLSLSIIALLIFINIRTAYSVLDTYSPIDKLGNPQCTGSRFCEYLNSINNSAAPGDCVLTLSAFRYYLRTDLFICSTGHDEYQRLQAASQIDSAALWGEIYRQGYKYIAYENDYTTRHAQLEIIPDPNNAPEWIDLEPLFGKPEDLQIAYKINVSNPPIQPETSCQKKSSGIWEVYSLTP